MSPNALLNRVHWGEVGFAEQDSQWEIYFYFANLIPL